MKECAHLFILLVITLSMLAFVFTHASKDSMSFKVFVGICFCGLAVCVSLHNRRLARV